MCAGKRTSSETTVNRAPARLMLDRRRPWRPHTAWGVPMSARAMAPSRRSVVLEHAGARAGSRARCRAPARAARRLAAGQTAVAASARSARPRAGRAARCRPGEASCALAVARDARRGGRAVRQRWCGAAMWHGPLRVSRARGPARKRIGRPGLRLERRTWVWMRHEGSPAAGAVPHLRGELVQSCSLSLPALLERFPAVGVKPHPRAGARGQVKTAGLAGSSAEPPLLPAALLPALGPLEVADVAAQLGELALVELVSVGPGTSSGP